jgi:hypothetical protein
MKNTTKLLPLFGAIALASVVAFPASLALTTTTVAPAAWAVVAGLGVYTLAKGLE